MFLHQFEFDSDHILYQEAPRQRTILVKPSRLPSAGRFAAGIAMPFKSPWITLLTFHLTPFIVAHDYPWQSIEEFFQTEFYNLEAGESISGIGGVCLGDHLSHFTDQGYTPLQAFWLTAFQDPLTCHPDKKNTIIQQLLANHVANDKTTT